MSQISRAIFGAAAIALTLGAIPLAAGRDLSEDFAAVQSKAQSLDVQSLAGTPATEINRAAKADRVTAVARSELPMRTIALQLNGLADTSVLVRVPVAQAARPGSAAPAWTQSGKRAEACEPVVSVLTEVAKQLQPGRCLT
jgi:hypothetical protein